jgi:DNA polymerase III delta subunit
MLYLIYGTDFKKNRQELKKLVDGLQKRRPEAGLFKITDEDFISSEVGESKFAELISSQGLFGGSYIVVCDHIFNFAEDLVKKNLSRMSTSLHVFIFIEDGLLKLAVKAFEKAGGKIVANQLTVSKKEPFNVFSLADAFCSKNKKSAWEIYTMSRREGIPAEQSLGIIYWQLKNVWLVKTSGNAKDLGLKSFVLNKSKRLGEKWREKELEAMSGKLVSIHHEARLGGDPLDIALERTILSL